MSPPTPRVPCMPTGASSTRINQRGGPIFTRWKPPSRNASVSGGKPRHVYAVDLQRREYVPGPISDAGAGSRRRVRAGDDRPASPRGVQRHLGRRIWLPGERPVFLRLGPALCDHLRRRRSDSLASGWQHCAAQQLRRFTDPPCGCALQRRFGLRGRRGVDGILEVYNLFNHANYGAYTLAESNASYGSRYRTWVSRTSRACCSWGSASCSDPARSLPWA